MYEEDSDEYRDLCDDEPRRTIHEASEALKVELGDTLKEVIKRYMAEFPDAIFSGDLVYAAKQGSVAVVGDAQITNPKLLPGG